MGQQSLQYRTRARRKIGLLALAGATCLGGMTIGVAPAGAEPGSAAVAKPAIVNDVLATVAATALAELQTSLAGDESNYGQTRDAIATEAANRLGIDPARMITAWQNADLSHQTALIAAFTQLGVPYRGYTSKPGVGFDCSGLTTYAWGVAGVTLTRQSGSQIRAASPRTLETAMAGDLMYYPGHVAMYLGVDRAMIHSPQTGRTVEVANMRKSPRFGNPIG